MTTPHDSTTDDMDKAAQVAALAFSRLEAEAARKSGDEALTLENVKAWWRAHYLTAGHKRLAKILLGSEGRAKPAEKA